MVIVAPLGTEPHWSTLVTRPCFPPSSETSLTLKPFCDNCRSTRVACCPTSWSQSTWTTWPPPPCWSPPPCWLVVGAPPPPGVPPPPWLPSKIGRAHV